MSQVGRSDSEFLRNRYCPPRAHSHSGRQPTDTRMTVTLLAEKTMGKMKVTWPGTSQVAPKGESALIHQVGRGGQGIPD